MKSRILICCIALISGTLSALAQINCPPHLPLTLVGNTTYCIGTPGVDLNIDELYAGYEWLPTAETGQSVFLEAGNYEIVVTHYTGCTDTLAFEVEQVSNPPQPTVVADGSVQFCAGGSVLLSGPAGYPYYEWNTGSISEDITVFESGTFVLSIIDWIGCTSSSNSIQVVVDPLPIAAFSPNLSVFEIEFVNQSEFATDYEWHFGDGATSTDFEPTHTYTIEGMQNMYLVASNDCGSDTAFLDLNSVGIEETNGLVDLSIFPNPSYGHLSLTLNSIENQELTVSLVDAFGRQVFTEAVYVNGGVNSFQFDFEAYSKGIYYLQMNTSSEVIAKKIVLQ